MKSMTVQKLAVILGKYHIIVAKRTIVKKKNSTVYVLFQFIPYKTFCSITFNDAMTYECHYFLFNLTLHWDIKNIFFYCCTQCVVKPRTIF